jgi:glycosyltransferase involved in cell wall biosynthesis
MRILVLIHEYPPVGGGGGRVAQDLCQGFVQHGHEVCVLTAQCGDLPAQEDQDGIQIMRINSWRREPFRADLRAMAGYVLGKLGRIPEVGDIIQSDGVSLTVLAMDGLRIARLSLERLPPFADSDVPHLA